MLPRVLFTHRYSMKLIRHLCAVGEYPRHHLWGADALERAGYPVEYGFFGRYSDGLRRLSWLAGEHLGDIEQQAVMLHRADRNSVLYAGEASVLRGIVRLRRLGLRTPVVGIVHEGGAWVRGLDVAICLSSKLRNRLVGRFGRDPARTPVVPWGPDLEFPGYVPTAEDIVVSAGKTDRDHATLLRALRDLDLPARVYAELPESRSGRVEVVGMDPGRPLAFGDVLDDLRRASIVAIPLVPAERLVALTEINDALALGKPIVMTRTDNIDFDPERVGCGISVDPHDVAGWREALARLAGDPALRAEMGARGRAYAAGGYNAATFGAAVEEAVRVAVAG